MTNQAFVFIPYWVETALNRSSLSLNTCLDYAKLRQILSLEDMSGLLAIQDIKSLTREESSFNNGTLFSMWSQSIPDAMKSEFLQAVVPMSRSTELKINILKRLETSEVPAPFLLPGIDQAPVEPTYYKVVDIAGATNAIVIYKGFATFVSDPENEYKFVVDQLKVFYVYLKAYQVSLLPIFKKYLRMLAIKAHVA